MTSTSPASTTQLGELYMILHDRHYLLYLLARERISQRRLAQEIGWKAHSKLNRLIRGEEKTLAPEPALRIAEFFKEPVDRMFTPKVSRSTASTVSEKGRAA